MSAAPNIRTGSASRHAYAYAAACVALIEAIKATGELGDDQLHVLLAAEPSATDRKLLALSLKLFELISHEQCAMAFYSFNLKEA